MKSKFTEEKIVDVAAELIAVPFRQGGLNKGFEALNRKGRNGLLEQAEQEKFKGATERSFVWRGKLSGRIVHVFVFGVGKSTSTSAVLRRGVAKAVRYATAHRLRSVAVYLDEPSGDHLMNEVRWSTEAMILAAYRFRKHKTKSASNPVPKEGLVGVHGVAFDVTKCRLEVSQAKAIAQGVVLARDLVNEPANVLSPGELAERAQAMATHRGLECTVLSDKQIRKQEMNLLLAVAAGSSRAPSFTHLVYRPSGKPRAVVALVGKGVTFDSGGLCLKPGKSMYTMKTDMAGAGVVLGVMSALKTLKPQVEVHGIIPATDNLVGTDATRPGDVVKSMSGLTVEILNTDAEGRLILADALTYATKLKPDAIIDCATLTGACLAALGAERAGLFASTDDIAQQVLGAAERAGELLWRLPLAAELERDVTSDVADLKNIGGQYGGAVTAALFLKRFVGKIPWIHIDLAGPARAEKTTDLCPKGGSGFGVLTGLEYLKSY